MQKLQFKLCESSVSVLCDVDGGFESAVREVSRCRAEVLAYARRNPEFLYSLDPIEVGRDAPEVVRLAASAAFKAGVGPMAALPGAIADMAAQALLRVGATTAVVENGGEVAVAALAEPVTVLLKNGGNSAVEQLALMLEPSIIPLGVATSSARYGHSLSFGAADAVLVVAESAALADAAATAICNATSRGIRAALTSAKKIDGVRGILILHGEETALWGELPEVRWVEDCCEEV